MCVCVCVRARFVQNISEYTFNVYIAESCVNFMYVAKITCDSVCVFGLLINGSYESARRYIGPVVWTYASVTLI